MERPHWEYYRTVVQDLETLSRYVEFAPSNYTTHSIELVRILLSVGSEIDVVSKVLCQQVAPQALAKSIDDYRAVLFKEYPKLPTVEVSIPKHSLIFAPWKDWERGVNPIWWRSYNKVKHERNKHYNQANLENALLATAGLCILVSYLYHNYFESKVIRRPLLFLDNKHEANGAPLCAGRYSLPDFKITQE